MTLKNANYVALAFGNLICAKASKPESQNGSSAREAINAIQAAKRQPSSAPPTILPCAPTRKPSIIAGVITFLEGTLAEALPTHLVVNVQGVGYEVLIPLSSYDKLPLPGRPLKILTHLQVREDAHILYGFMSAAERDLFRLLVNHVSGIGPKLALAVLSGMSVPSFKGAVVSSDVSSLSKISGIGKKTAERIVLELKDKVGVAAAWEAASAANAPSAEDVQVNDAVLALISLGYKQIDAHKAVKRAQSSAAGASWTAEDLVRQALKLLI